MGDIVTFDRAGRMLEAAELSENAADLNGAPAEVVDFAVKQAEACNLSAQDVSPEVVLKMALKDAQDDARITRAYITLIVEEPGHLRTINYRAGLNRAEEVAYRQIGVQETVETWRGLD